MIIRAHSGRYGSWRSFVTIVDHICPRSERGDVADLRRHGLDHSDEDKDLGRRVTNITRVLVRYQDTGARETLSSSGGTAGLLHVLPTDRLASVLRKLAP